MARADRSMRPHRRANEEGFEASTGVQRDASAQEDAYASLGTNSRADVHVRAVARRSRTDERYSRSGAASRYADQARKRRRRNTIIRRAAIAVLAVFLTLGGAAFAYVSVLNGNLSQGLDAGLQNVLVRTDIVNEPFYMLLMGTDEDLQRDEDLSTDGVYRTDTIMLARIDPVDNKVTIVSIPRDLMVEIDGYGTQKINAAYALAGASQAVTTVADVAGVSISHFGIIDMDGLVSVVDALGGIEVDVPIEIDDDYAGGHVDAGLQTLSGEEALILCRSRHSYDSVGKGDEYRAANQRLVIQAIANKILSSDIATIASTITTLSEYVQTDLSVNDIIALAQALQGIDTSNDIYTGSMPTESQYIDSLWYEVAVEPDWANMMERVDEGLPPTEETEIDAATGTVLSNSGDGTTSDGTIIAPKTGTIVVRNGTTTAGLAQTAADTLTAEGYTVGDVGNANSSDYDQTLVIYAEESDAKEAQAIAQVLGNNAQAQINDGSYLMSGDFLVVIGADFSG